MQELSTDAVRASGSDRYYGLRRSPSQPVRAENVAHRL